MKSERLKKYLLSPHPSGEAGGLWGFYNIKQLKRQR